MSPTSPLLHDLVFLLSGGGVAGSTSVFDQSVNNHPITLGGNAVLSANRAKFYETSFYVDGVGDYGSANSVVPLVYASPFITVGGWFYLEELMTGINSLFGFHTSTGTNQFVVGREQVYGNTGFTTTSFEACPVGEWFHFAAVLEMVKKTYRLYKNGQIVLTGSWTGTGGNLLVTDRFSFGQEWDSSTATDFMKGNIQDLFVYNGALYISPFTPPGPMLGEISGTVLDETGTASPGRKVFAVPRSYPMVGSHETVTDALGNYAFPLCMKGIEYAVVVPDASAKKLDKTKRAMVKQD